LSEGVCRQLGIISYHPDVHPSKARKVNVGKNVERSDQGIDGSNAAVIPLVYVQLVEGVRLLPQQ